jgi:hypothetical protein
LRIFFEKNLKNPPIPCKAVFRSLRSQHNIVLSLDFFSSLILSAKGECEKIAENSLFNLVAIFSHSPFAIGRKKMLIRKFYVKQPHIAISTVLNSFFSHASSAAAILTSLLNIKFHERRKVY